MISSTSEAETPTSAAPPGRPARLIAVGALIVAALIGAVTAGLLGPHGRMSDDRTGDAALLADIDAAGGAGPGVRSLSVGRIDGDTASTAGLGNAGDGAPEPSTRYELGSITKTFTGMLLADGVERGELALDDPLARHLPELAGTAAGEATLVELATHTSGLPRLPSGSIVGVLADQARGLDPYRNWSTDDVIEAARTAEVEAAGDSSYSNFGMALLGAAQARAAGAPSWTTLVRERLLDPLGMSQTTFGDRPEQLAAPHQANGWPAPLWAGEGFYPTGSGTRSTVEDMLRYAAAVLDGTAPGIAAVEPVHVESDTSSTGLAWFIRTDPESGRETLWHNGGTGGSRTMLAIDLEQRQAAITLNNSAADVDAVGLRLAGASIDDPSRSLFATAIAYGVLAVAVISVIATIRRLLRGPTLLGQLSTVAGTVFALALALRLGPWETVPAAVPGALIGVTVGALILIIVRKLVSGTPPTAAAKRPWAAGIDLAINVALAAVALWML